MSIAIKIVDGSRPAEDLPEALAGAALDIARLDFGGPKWVANKVTIAESFNKNIYTDECGAIIDPTSGKVWVVAFDKGVYRYWRAW